MLPLSNRGTHETEDTVGGIAATCRVKIEVSIAPWRVGVEAPLATDSHSARRIAPKRRRIRGRIKILPVGDGERLAARHPVESAQELRRVRRHGAVGRI